MKKNNICKIGIITLVTLMMIGTTSQVFGKDLQQAEPVPPCFYGTVYKENDPCQYTLVSGLFLGEMSISQNPDGSWNPAVWVGMHFIFTPLCINKLNLQGINLVTNDNHSFTGTMTMNNVTVSVRGSYSVHGCFYKYQIKNPGLKYTIVGWKL